MHFPSGLAVTHNWCVAPTMKEPLKEEKKEASFDMTREEIIKSLNENDSGLEWTAVKIGDPPKEAYKCVLKTNNENKERKLPIKLDSNNEATIGKYDAIALAKNITPLNETELGELGDYFKRTLNEQFQPNFDSSERYAIAGQMTSDQRKETETFFKNFSAFDGYALNKPEANEPKKGELSVVSVEFNDLALRTFYQKHVKQQTLLNNSLSMNKDIIGSPHFLKKWDVSDIISFSPENIIKLLRIPDVRSSLSPNHDNHVIILKRLCDLPKDEADKSIKEYFELMKFKPEEKFIDDLVNFPAKNIITVLDCIIKNNPYIEIKEDDYKRFYDHIAILTKLCGQSPPLEAYKSIKDYFTLMKIKPNGLLITDIGLNLKDTGNIEISNIIERGLNRYADDSKMTSTSGTQGVASGNAKYIATATQYIQKKVNALIESKEIDSPSEDKPYMIGTDIMIWKNHREIFYIKDTSAIPNITVLLAKEGVDFFNSKGSVEYNAKEMLNKALLKFEPLQKIVISDTAARRYQAILKGDRNAVIDFRIRNVEYNIKMGENENLLSIIDPKKLPTENQIRAVINFEGQENGKVEVLEAGKIGLNTGETDPSKWRPYDEAKRTDIVELAVVALKNSEQDDPFMRS
jgi:hypothetical protein